MKDLKKMSPSLKPLLLPQLVEERRKRESISDPDVDLFATRCYSQNSSTSDFPSPVTPTFSARGHSRYPSSSSSVESTFHSNTNESSSSPAFVASKPGKRSLPDVQEEDHEKEEDIDMFEIDDELYDCACDDQQCPHHDCTVAQSSVQLSRGSDFDYDLADGFFSDGEISVSPRLKKRRQESTINGLASRFGTRFPSFSRKWRSRKDISPLVVAADAQREKAISRSASSRSSSISNSARQTISRSFEPQMPPTPTRSLYDSREDLATTLPIDIEKANGGTIELEENFATTPLLPPLMTDASANSRHVSMQSPLQSPSVAECNDPFSANVTPIDAITTPQLPGMPSPPLSAKPSNSSFHRSSRPSHLIPSSEIPPILIADPNDIWANKLGHANFTIYPEPYLPESFDLEACRQLRVNWDLARCNYTKHLVRTGEHYGVTSKTYKLTEEKWSSVDSEWRRHNDQTIANTVENSSEAFATLKHTTLGEPGSTNLMTKIPSLNDPRSGGKFPQLGDEDIVGPMVQVAAQLQRTPSKKAKLFKFFAEKFPVGLGKSNEQH